MIQFIKLFYYNTPQTQPHTHTSVGGKAKSLGLLIVSYSDLVNLSLY